MSKMENICLICKKIPQNDQFSIQGLIPEYEMKIEDILTDLNYKIPDEDFIPQIMCYNCCCDLILLYNFRENFCTFFEVTKKFQSTCQLCSKPNYFISLSEDTIINGQCIKICEIFSRICRYNLNMMYNEDHLSCNYICEECYDILINIYPFHVKCEKAVTFWTGYVLKSKKRTEHCQLNEVKLKQELHMLSLDRHEYEQYSCKFCLRIFNHKGNYRRHILLHLNKGLFMCKICSKTFKRKDYLTTHESLYHKEKTLFSCEICLKSFTQKVYLNRHLKRHEKSGRYACNICSNTFTYQYDLNRHLGTHIDKQEIKMFQCDKCPKMFKRKHDLNQHFRIQHSVKNLYQCEICFKKFNRKGVLTRHRLLHSKERLFECKFCLKSFTKQFYLNDHIVSHLN